MITKGTKIKLYPDRKDTVNFSKHKVSEVKEKIVPEVKEKILEPRNTGCYQPPIIPNTKVFDATVSCIGDDGTIFVVPKLSGKIVYIIKISKNNS